MNCIEWLSCLFSLIELSFGASEEEHPALNTIAPIINIGTKRFMELSSYYNYEKIMGNKLGSYSFLSGTSLPLM
jgi:hypothetical protein